MRIDSQNLIISVQCRRFGDYMSSRLNECCITMDIRNILKRPNNSGFERKKTIDYKCYTALPLVARKTTNLNEYFRKYILISINRMGACAWPSEVAI